MNRHFHRWASRRCLCKPGYFQSLWTRHGRCSFNWTDVLLQHLFGSVWPRTQPFWSCQFDRQDIYRSFKVQSARCLQQSWDPGMDCSSARNCRGNLVILELLLRVRSLWLRGACFSPSSREGFSSQAVLWWSRGCFRLLGWRRPCGTRSSGTVWNVLSYLEEFSSFSWTLYRRARASPSASQAFAHTSQGTCHFAIKWSRLFLATLQSLTDTKNC